MPAAMADGTVYEGSGDIVAANWNMTSFVVTRDQGHHWTAIQLKKPPAGTRAVVDRIAVADGHVYALVQLIPKTGAQTIALYSATPATTWASCSAPPMAVTPGKPSRCPDRRAVS